MEPDAESSAERTENSSDHENGYDDESSAFFEDDVVPLSKDDDEEEEQGHTQDADISPSESKAAAPVETPYSNQDESEQFEQLLPSDHAQMSSVGSPTSSRVTLSIDDGNGQIRQITLQPDQITLGDLEEVLTQSFGSVEDLRFNEKSILQEFQSSARLREMGIHDGALIKVRVVPFNTRTVMPVIAVPSSTAQQNVMEMDIEGTSHSQSVERRRMEIEYEQVVSALETRYLESENQVKKLSAALRECQRDRDDAVSNRHSQEAKLTDLTLKFNDANIQIASLTSKLDAFEHDRRDELSYVNKKDSELIRLREENTVMSERLSEERKSMLELRGKLTDKEAEASGQEHKMFLMQREIEQLEAQSNFLNEELQRKSSQFLEYRTHKLAQVNSLESDLRKKQEDLDSLALELTACKSRDHVNQEKLLAANSKRKEIEDEMREKELAFGREMRGLAQLNDNLKSLNRALTEDNNSHQASIASLQEVVEHNKAEYIRVIQELTAEKDRFLHELHAKDNAMKELESEKGKLMLLAEQAVNPDPNPFISMSPHGISSTPKTPLKNDERARTKRLEKQLDVLSNSYGTSLQNKAVSEMSEIVDRSRSMAAQIESNASEIEKLKFELSKADNKRRAAEKKALMIEEERNELSHQCKILLAQINGEQNDMIIANTQFKDVEELFTKYEQLRRSYQDLQSEAQGQLYEAQTTLKHDYEEKLKELNLKVERLSEAREKQKNEIEEMIRYAEYWKSKASQNENEGTLILRQNVGDNESSRIAREQVENEFRKWRDDAREHMQALQHDNDKKRLEIFDLNMKLKQALSDADHYKDQYQIVTDAKKQLKAEIDVLEKKYQHECTVVKHLEAEFKKHIEELQECQDKLRKCEFLVGNHGEEKRLLREAIQQVRDQNTLVTKDRDRLNDYLNRTREELIVKDQKYTDLENKLAVLRTKEDEEIQALRVRLEDEISRNSGRNVQLDADIKSYQRKIEMMTDDYQKAREELAASRALIENCQAQNIELLRKVTDLEVDLRKKEFEETRAEQIMSTASTDPDEKTRMLYSQAEKLKLELDDLRIQLKTSLDEISSLQHQREEMRSTLEISSVKEQTLIDGKQRADAELAVAQDILQERQTELEQLRNSFADTQKTRDEVLEEFEKSKRDWYSTKELLEIQLKQAKEVESSIEEREADLRMQLQDLAESVSDYQRKYESELIAHAEALKIVDPMKENLARLTEQLAEASAQAEVANSNLTAAENLWKQQRDQQQQNLDGLRKSYEDAVNQNNILQSLLESKFQSSEIPTELINTTDGEAGHKLMEVLSGQRARITTLELERQSALARVARLEQQAERQNQTIEELRLSLNEAQQTDVAARIAQDYHDMLKKLEDYNLLRESNASLRDENERHYKRVRELDVALRNFEEQIEPLLDDKRSLSNQLEIRNMEIAKLEEQNQRWQNRVQNLVTKYERIDPNEFEQYKNDCSTLKENVESLQSSLADAQKVIQAFENVAEEKKQSENKFKVVAKKYIALKNEFEETTKMLQDSQKSLSSLQKLQPEADSQVQTQESSSIPSAEMTLRESLWHRNQAALLEENRSLRREKESLKNDVEKAAEVARKERTSQGLEQSESISALETQLHDLEAKNQLLTEELTRLQTDKVAWERESVELAALRVDISVLREQLSTLKLDQNRLITAERKVQMFEERIRKNKELKARMAQTLPASVGETNVDSMSSIDQSAASSITNGLPSVVSVMTNASNHAAALSKLSEINQEGSSASEVIGVSVAASASAPKQFDETPTNTLMENGDNELQDTTIAQTDISGIALPESMSVDDEDEARTDLPNMSSADRVALPTQVEAMIEDDDTMQQSDSGSANEPSVNSQAVSASASAGLHQASEPDEQAESVEDEETVRQEVPPEKLEPSAPESSELQEDVVDMAASDDGANNEDLSATSDQGGLNSASAEEEEEAEEEAEDEEAEEEEAGEEEAGEEEDEEIAEEIAEGAAKEAAEEAAEEEAEEETEALVEEVPEGETHEEDVLQDIEDAGEDVADAADELENAPVDAASSSSVSPTALAASSSGRAGSSSTSPNSKRPIDSSIGQQQRGAKKARTHRGKYFRGRGRR